MHLLPLDRRTIFSRNVFCGATSPFLPPAMVILPAARGLGGVPARRLTAASSWARGPRAIPAGSAPCGPRAPGLTAPSNTAERRGPAGMRPRAAGLSRPRRGRGRAGGSDPPASHPYFLQPSLAPLCRHPRPSLICPGGRASDAPRLGSQSSGD